MTEPYHNQGWFGRHPEIYHRADYFMRILRQKAARRLTLAPESRILDLATGTGAQGIEFAKLGHQVIGVDLDEKMLEKAREKSSANLAFLHGDATQLPFPVGYFDLAVISFAMHDVPYPIGIQFLQEAKRVLNHSGRIFIVEHEDPKDNIIARIFFWIALTFETPNHKRFFKVSLEDYFLKTGLVLLEKTQLAFGAVRLITAGKLS